MTTIELPKRTHLVQKAIEPRALSKAVQDSLEGATTIVQYKYDGCHCIVICAPDGSFRAVTRQGGEVYSVDHLASALARVSPGYVFFGEVWAAGWSHSQINGAFRSHTEQLDLALRLFDVVPYDAFFTGRCSTAYRFRRAYLEGIPSHHGITWDIQLAATIDLPREPGEYDGYIHWNMDKPWLAGAGKEGHCVKDKDVYSADLKVIDLVEGAGKFEGMVGALICEFKGRTINVGGGKLTTMDRLRYWKTCELVGKIVEVHALSETAAGDLREARFIRIRDDKTEPSYE